MKTMVLLETENGARYTHLLDDVPTRKLDGCIIRTLTERV